MVEEPRVEKSSRQAGWRRRARHRRSTLAGVVLIVIGLALLLEELDLVDIDLPWSWWPLLLVALGVLRLLLGDGRPTASAWMIFIGLWLFACFEGYWGLTVETSWPVVLVFAGVMVLLRPLWPDGSGE